MFRRSVFSGLCGVAAWACACGASAITLGQVDDFQDGTPQGWTAGFSHPLPPSVSEDSGPAGGGDDALLIQTNGAEIGPGSKLAAFNQSQWLGDYTAAGVSAIKVDLSNPNSVALSIRVVLDGLGGKFASDAFELAPSSGVWTTALFPLDAAGLNAADGINNLPATLSNTFDFRIIHNSAVSHQGAPVGVDGNVFAAQLLIDNITAVGVPIEQALGDYNGSGQVEQGDLDLVLQNWGRDTDTEGVPDGWIEQLPQGQIEQTELDAVLANWGTTGGAPDFGGSAVPEPGLSASVVLLGGVLRRRHQ